MGIRIAPCLLYKSWLHWHLPQTLAPPPPRPPPHPSFHLHLHFRFHPLPNRTRGIGIHQTRISLTTVESPLGTKIDRLYWFRLLPLVHITACTFCAPRLSCVCCRRQHGQTCHLHPQSILSVCVWTR